MQARGLVFVVVAMLGGAAWFACHRSRAGNDASLMPTRSAGAPAIEPSEPEFATHEFLEPQEPQRAAVTSSPTEAQLDVLAPKATASTTTQRLSGSVVAVDSTGTVLESIDGEFRIWARGGSDVVSERVLVKRGEWSIDFESESPLELEVQQLVTPESYFVIVQPIEGSRFAFPENGRLEIRARETPRSILHVVDERSRHPLSDVEIVRASGEGMKHPGSGGLRLVQDLVSPIDLVATVPLEHRKYASEFFVGARGYQWERITVDFLVGGEQTIALGPGGDLHVTLVGAERTSLAKLRLRPAGGVTHVRSVDGSTTAHTRSEGEHAVIGEVGTTPAERLFSRLPPGPLRAAVELDGSRGEWTELGGVDVTIVAGQRVRTTITVQAPPKPAIAQARGMLFVPSAWQAKDPKFTATLLDESVNDRGSFRAATVTRSDERRAGFDVFEWRFTALQVARYQWTLREPPLKGEMDVPVGGIDDLEIVVPAPTELLVRIVDSRTGLDIVPDYCRWFPKGPGNRTESSIIATRDPQSGLYRIVAPATWIELYATDSRYLLESASIDLTPGPASHTLAMDPANTLEIVLKDGETTIPYPGAAHEIPRPVGDGVGMIWGTSRKIFHQRFQLDEPGLWEFQPPTIPGYRTPDLATIDVRAGQVTMHEIQLVRE